MKRLLLSCLALLVCAVMWGQRTVTGTVTDNAGEPLIGANVVAKGTTAGTITDYNGEYELTLPEGVNVIVVSYTGFQTKEVEVGDQDEVNVTLSEGVQLTEAVVTALGISRDEKALGYGVQTLSGDEVSDSRTVNVVDALAGKTAGIQVTNASGAAGAPSRIVLRGQTSFNGNNEALIVVDGVRLDNSEFHSERSLAGVANSSRVMDLNPEDIKSINVLKGGAATALYGSEGARGVILIETKKGQESDDVQVQVNSNYSISEYNKMPDMQNKFTQGFNGQWAGPSTAFVPSALSWGARADTMYWNGNSDYKWDKNGQLVGQSSPDAEKPFEPYDNIDNFYRNGRTIKNNVSISGGNDQYTYRASFGHTDQEGIVPLNDFTRTNVGFGGTADFLDDRLSVSTSINYVKSGGRRIQQGSNISGVNLGLFRTPISFDNANGVSDEPWNSEEAYLFDDNTQRNFRAGTGYDNPFWIVNLAPFFDNVNRMYGNLKLKFDVTDWLSLDAKLGTDFYSDFREQEFEIGSNAFPSGRIIDDKYNYRHYDLYFGGSGSFNLTPEFSFNYNAGVNLYDEQLENISATGDGLNFFGFRDLNNTASITTVKDNSNVKTVGLFGVLEVGYNDMVYLSVTGRNDWLSTLIVPSKEFSGSDISVFYPSVTGSFILSEIYNPSWLSFAKVRASYAQVGGGAPNPYLTSTNYLVPNTPLTVNTVADGWTNGIFWPFNGVPGFTQNAVLGAEELSPSLTTDVEVGVDFRFLDNRIGVDASWYTRESTDQIIAINIPNSSGYQRRVINNGELETVGGEVILNLNPIRSSGGFRWDIQANFSKWTTTVERLPEGVPNQYLDGFTGSAVYNIAPETDEEGNIIKKYEYGQIYGGAFQHVNDPNDENGDGLVFDPNKPYNPDGALIIGEDGYPLVDPVQRVIGNPNPDFLLGLNNTFSWKGFTLSALIDIREGGDLWNGTKGALTFFGRSANTADRDAVDADPTHVFDGVTPEGDPNEQAVLLDQNWYLGNGGGFGSVAEHFIEDGSFIRLREVGLSYTFDQAFLNNTFEKLTLSFTGRNLWLETDYTGVDPETSLVGASSNGQGLDYFQFPNTRRFVFGLSATF